jgi:hypothetical protein
MAAPGMRSGAHTQQRPGLGEAPSLLVVIGFAVFAGCGVATVTAASLDRLRGCMRALARPASNAARHRPTRHGQQRGARAGHQWYTAFGTAVGAAALASAVLFIMPDPAAYHVARGCGPGTCTAGLAMPAHAGLRPSASPSATTPAPAPPRAAPAGPARQHRASPSPSPHRGRAWGLAHRRHGRLAGTGPEVALARSPARLPASFIGGTHDAV